MWVNHGLELYLVGSVAPALTMGRYNRINACCAVSGGCPTSVAMMRNRHFGAWRPRATKLSSAHIIAALRLCTLNARRAESHC